MEPLSPEEKLRELMAQRDETAAQRAREEAELASLQSGTNDALARLADIEAQIGGGSAPKPTGEPAGDTFARGPIIADGDLQKPAPAPARLSDKEQAREKEARRNKERAEGKKRKAQEREAEKERKRQERADRDAAEEQARAEKEARKEEIGGKITEIEKELAATREQRTRETGTFTTDIIKESIENLLGSNSTIKEITNLEVEGNGNEINLSTTIRAEKGVSATVTIDLSLGTMNNGLGILRQNLNIEANSLVKGRVRSLIEGELGKINERIKSYIEEQTNRNVEKMWIEDGQLKVLAEGQPTLREEELKRELEGLRIEYQEIDKAPPRLAGPSRKETREARRAEQEAENKKWNLEVAERIRRRIREEEGRRGTLTAEEKQAVARVIFLQSKEERQQAELESSGKISKALEKTGKWWSEDLERSKRGKLAKVAISSALIGSTTLAGAAIFGIVPPPLGIARRLLLRVGMATGLNMLMTSNIPGKLGSKNQAGGLRGHFNAQKFQYLAMAGGLGAVFLLSGGAVAVTAVGAGGIALRKLFSKMLDTAISEGKKYREDELQAISRAGVDDNFDINDLASELERLGKYYDDVSRKIAVIKRLKNVGNAVVTIVTGITTISVATEHAMAEQAGQPAEQPETPEEQEPAPAPEDITTQAEDKSLLERLKEKIGLGEKDEESTPDKPEEAEPKQTPPSRRGGPGTPAPAPAQPVTPAVPVVAPGAGREISENFRVVLGEDGVPQNIETVFNQIAASHMDLPPEGMNEEFTAKSLNMAANLVRLSEGHNTAGVSTTEFQEAFSFRNGVLTVENHDNANEILSRFENNAKELWENGTLKGQGAAVSHLNDEIGKDYWLKVAQAKGLEGFVPGHDTLTAEKITDFGESEMVKQAKLGEAVGSGAISHEDEVVAARERLEQAYSQVGEQKPQISENFTQPIQPVKMEPTEVIKEAASPESQNAAVPYQEAVTAGNPYGLSAVAAEQVQRATG